MISLSKYNSKYKNILHSIILENTKENSTYILDVGCGKGDDLQKISSIKRNTVGCGIDISLKSLITASGKLKRNKNFYILQSKAEFIPFKKESFDTVISSEVLEHIEEIEKFIREVYRILKYNGIFVVTTPSRYNYVSLLGKIIPSPFKRFLRRSVYYLNPGEDKNPHFYEYTPGELKRLFEDNSFVVEKIESGVLRVPVWPLFDNLPFLVFLWSCLDRFIDKFPFGIYLKLNFIMAGRKL